MLDVYRGNLEGMDVRMKVDNENQLSAFQQSVGDDLEVFLTRLQEDSFHKSNNFLSVTFCMPMLTKKELQLLNQKNRDFIKTFAWYYYGKEFDINEVEMRKEYFIIEIWILFQNWRNLTLQKFVNRYLIV